VLSIRTATLLLALLLAPAATLLAAEDGGPVAPRGAAREGATESLAGDGAEIAFRVYGESRGPALVFVHGWSCDSRYWSAQVDAFTATHLVVTVDLAGHGASSSGERTQWSMANFGADVTAVVEALALERVVLVGHSMGGPVVLEAARRLGPRVLGVVGVDTWRDAAVRRTAEQSEALVGSFRKDFAAQTAAFVDGNFFVDSSDPGLRRWIVEDMAEAPPEVAMPALLELLQYDHPTAFAALKVPVVAINASAEPTDAAALAALSAGLRVLGIDETGHFPMLERPAQFNSLLSVVLGEWTAPTP
jgi:pimeloyl-ACP methyl ester carboxylesterase